MAPPPPTPDETPDAWLCRAVPPIVVLVRIVGCGSVESKPPRPSLPVYLGIYGWGTGICLLNPPPVSACTPFRVGPRPGPAPTGAGGPRPSSWRGSRTTSPCANPAGARRGPCLKRPIYGHSGAHATSSTTSSRDRSASRATDRYSPFSPYGRPPRRMDAAVSSLGPGATTHPLSRARGGGPRGTTSTCPTRSRARPRGSSPRPICPHKTT